MNDHGCTWVPIKSEITETRTWQGTITQPGPARVQCIECWTTATRCAAMHVEGAIRYRCALPYDHDVADDSEHANGELTW